MDILVGYSGQSFQLSTGYGLAEYSSAEPLRSLRTSSVFMARTSLSLLVSETHHRPVVSRSNFGSISVMVNLRRPRRCFQPIQGELRFPSSARAA